MKIKRKDLNRLIENFLKESIDDGEDDFELTDDMLDSDQSAHEEYVKAVDAYRHPEKPVGNIPNLFRKELMDPHIPSNEELEHHPNVFDHYA